jgi:hypothetical protein
MYLMAAGARGWQRESVIPEDVAALGGWQLPSVPNGITTRTNIWMRGTYPAASGDAETNA